MSTVLPTTNLVRSPRQYRMSTKKHTNFGHIFKEHAIYFLDVKGLLRATRVEIPA
jgi:hypothetical protein